MRAGRIGGADGGEGPARIGGVPPRFRTHDQRARFERDLVIYLVHSRFGLSYRLLARAFRLSRGAIYDAIARMKAQLADRGLDAEALARDADGLHR